MKIKSYLSREGLNGLVEDNKEILVPIAVIAAAILLFIMFVLPQALSFPSKKNDRDIEIAKLNQIKQAKKVLESIDSSKLDSDLELASNALPSDKNFEIILNAISTAASQSNSQIESYTFNELGKSALDVTNKLPGLFFEIKIIGDVNQAALFVDQLNKTYPISDVTMIDYRDGIAKVSAVFYYKPFTSVQATDAALARDKTQAEQGAMNEISKWNESSFLPSFPQAEVSSESAGIRTSPF